VAYIEEEIQRINRLIEDFLAFAKPAKPAFRVVDANAMAREGIDRFRRMDLARDMAFQVTVPEVSCLSYLDPDLLGRAMDNILKNAVEACNGRGVITVTAECGEERWRISIADDGCGISKDVAENLFNPFVTTRAKGTGLGLAYTAQVVAAHQGGIQVENSPGGGACFILDIPREPKSIDLWDGDGVRE
jgi:signal transduction histidine kinase